MVDQELTSKLAPLGQQHQDAGQPEVNPFDKGVSPTLDINQIRSDILRRATEPKNVEDRKIESTPSENAEHPASPPKALEDPVPTPPSESTPTSRPLALVGDTLRAVGARIVHVGEKLRSLPGVHTAIECFEMVAEVVSNFLNPERSTQTAVRYHEVPREDITQQAVPQHLITGPDSAVIALLKLRTLDDPLASSARFHAALVEAARELGEAAQRRDDQEKKESEARVMEEERLERLAAEAVRSIDNLSGTPNGETQSIIQKLTGPFAISIDQAIRLAREAEQHELSELQRLELEKNTLTERIASIDTAKYHVGA